MVELSANLAGMVVLPASIMGIDIYARWKGQTADDKQAQFTGFASNGAVGYLREAYHGQPYATKFLFAEAFDSETASAPIAARVLRERLPEALRLVEKRLRKVYRISELEEHEPFFKSFRDFVALCERKEAETGEPVTIIADH